MIIGWTNGPHNFWISKKPAGSCRPLWSKVGVGVNPADDVTPGRIYPPAAGGPKSLFFFSHKPYERKGFGYCCCFVGRVVVHYYHLVWRFGLLGDSLQAVANMGFFVVGWYNY